MAYILPHSGDYPDESFSVALDGDTYQFRLKWNGRDESWILFIGLNGEDYALSQKVTNGFNLLKKFYYRDGCPQGELYMLDTVKSYGRPDRDNTGIDKRFRLLYVEDGEEIE